MISIVYGFKDRRVKPLRKSLDSLMRQSCQQFEVVICNYGSDEFFSKELEGVVADYTFSSVIRSRMEGRLWNRSHALNIAIKKAKGEIIFTSDIDIVYPSNFIELLQNLISEKKIVFPRVNYLNTSSMDSSTLDNYQGALDYRGGKGISAFSKSLWEEVGGFDENYYYWGFEDTDFFNRLLKEKAEEVKLPEGYYLHHLWHESTYHELPSFLPTDLFAKFSIYEVHHKQISMRNDGEPGCPMSLRDRPLLSEKMTTDVIEIFHPWVISPSNLTKFVDFLYEQKSGSVLLFKIPKSSSKSIFNKVLQKIFRLELKPTKHYYLQLLFYWLQKNPKNWTDYFIDYQYNNKNYFAVYF